MSDSKNRLLDSVNYPSDIKSLNYEQLDTLSGEIRELLIETISKNGGHLASNLGVVELTLAMHKVFDTPKDQFVFDVGHQSYTHKILTGRKDRFSTIRKENGLSGYPKQAESEHDSFVAGHSSTSISVANGIAKAKSMLKEDGHVVAVIGDGALTGGLAYEGMNNAGRSGDRLIVILNDNEMSISKNVGGLAKYLSKIRSNPKYFRMKNDVEHFLLKIPFVGKSAYRFMRHSKEIIKSAIYHTTFFEEFGFVYMGPVNGHDIRQLVKVLRRAKRLNRPVMIHVETIKGKGYEYAEKRPTEYHGVPKFDIDTGNPDISASDSFSSVFGDALCEFAGVDDRICAITAAMGQGTGLKNYAKMFKKRYFDVGIAEAHATAFAAGLASKGVLPVFAVYSSFLQRAYDQLIHDCAIEKEHVVFAIDRAGIVGDDGETHQGLFDVPFLSTVPGMTVYSPGNYDELKTDLKKCLYSVHGPCALRYPRGAQSEYPSGFDIDPNDDYTLIAHGESDILLVTYGRIYAEAANAVAELKKEGRNVHILKLNKILPLSSDVIEIASKYSHVMFAEESYKIGSISQLMSDMLLESGYKGKYTVRAIENFVKHATVKSATAFVGLDAASIKEWIVYNNFNEN